MAGGARGQIIDGRFELLQRLGQGGMGTVWRAWDVALHREVALKEVRPQEEGDDEEDAPRPSSALRERVLREARALARLSHPNVVTIHHIIDIEPYPWLVMELVPGAPLQRRLKDGPLPLAEAVRHGRDVLAALRAAHAAGIHHRDVKPANVLLREDGSAVLTDFGIAAMAGSARVTATGSIVGSPEYLAPERIRGAPDHPSADLWSLGMLLYVLVEGYSPLRRGTTLATLTAVLEEPLPPPVRSGPLTPVLRALLVRDPVVRPDAERLDAMLAEAGAEARRVAAGPTVSVVAAVPPPPDRKSPAPPVPPAGPVRRPGTRALVAALAGALLMVGGVITGLLLLSGGAGDDEAVGSGPGQDRSDQERPAEQNPGEVSQPEPDEGLTDVEEPVEPEETAAPGGTPGPGADPTPDPSEEQVARGSWIAQLFSEPVSNGSASRDQRVAAVRAEVPEAQVLLSDEFASLNPGYWVIYVPGPFADGRAAVRFCADRGRTSSNECVGRYLSTDLADKELICHPQGGGSGRCEE
ncbi:serine/threonine-protein kinase [Streptomyces sp. ACA25]|uniref:serine/threonine-protein kinase n=1 Tax=Streptomyces sp. ACA25 TaxID=3022596 RepID=UPI002307DD83|nr:serine/threonine-protein kinase [Streptomyces sp. ACA25]MDB1088657.1 serine/threonine-protein kinase [Streptomyces sp. ACA25]